MVQNSPSNYNNSKVAETAVVHAITAL